MTRALKWRLAIGFLLVFLAGAATGVFAGAWHARDSFRGRHGGMMGDRMREHIARELDLTPEQQRELDPIIDRTTKELHAIRQETAERVTRTMEAAHRDFAPHLTPEQRDKVAKMKLRHMRIKVLHHREPPPPP